MSTSTSTSARDPLPTGVTAADQTKNLILATLAFAITFWAWNIIAPLGVFYAGPEQMNLSASQKSVLIAVPILVGSLGRIVVGVLTPRFGGRVMFTVLCVLSAPMVVLVAVAGELKSYPLMMMWLLPGYQDASSTGVRSQHCHCLPGLA